MSRTLTDDQVRALRTNGESDRVNGDGFGISRQAARKARTGETYPNHPTPPDRTRRKRAWRYAPKGDRSS